VHAANFPVWIRVLGGLQDGSKCSTSGSFENSSLPICPKWWCSEVNKATETHCNNPGTPTYQSLLDNTGDNADAKRILLAPLSPPTGGLEKTTRTPLHITWLSTIQHDLRCHNLTLPEAVDTAQNRPLWSLLSMSGTTQSLSYLPKTTTTAL